jgi:dockerin type I repeat protein
MRSLFGMVLVLTLLVVPASFAQRAGTLNLDADILTAGIQTPGDYSIAAQGNIVLYLTLVDVDDMIGVSADITYDPAVLKLLGDGQGLTEDRGDLNFDGAVNVTDILQVVNERKARDGGADPIDYYDINDDGAANVTDILRVVKNRQAADTGVNFWTNTRSGATVLTWPTGEVPTESVEIFDNNVSNGLIDDLVAVLLIRPNTSGVRVDTDRGFTSDGTRPDPATQNAVIARLEFEVLAASPTTTTLNVLAGADSLTGLGPNANTAVVLHEGMTVDQLAAPAANDLTINIVN